MSHYDSHILLQFFELVFFQLGPTAGESLM